MVFMNATGTIYTTLNALSGFTGNLFISLFLILMLLFLIGLVLRIPLEFTGALILPLCFTLWAGTGDQWLGITGVLLIYLAVVLARNIPINN